MLLAPPLPPVRLERGREVTLGRSPECEVRLPSGQASRRHAAVCWKGERVVLRDLGSTNGTFVNGERASGERVLESGDRIGVGDAEVLFYCVDASVAAPEVSSDGRTVVSFAPRVAPRCEALRGDLSKIPLFAVLQVLEMGGQSGCLTVEGPSGESFVWFASGRLVHAETGKARGLDAALEIAQIASGRFEFAAGSPPPEQSFEASVTEVILEACRLLDEARTG
jgi:pSer/pThr/pTyr-binding forkhead associated (FHA) protein